MSYAKESVKLVHLGGMLCTHFHRSILRPGTVPVHCPKSNPNFRDITQNVEENEILLEIFCIVSPFPRYISYDISEIRLPLGQCNDHLLIFDFLKESFSLCA